MISGRALTVRGELALCAAERGAPGNNVKAMETANSIPVRGKDDGVARIHLSFESSYPKKIERLQRGKESANARDPGTRWPVSLCFAQRTSPGAWEERRYPIISRIAMALKAQASALSAG